MKMKTDCPMQSKFLTPQIVYEAEVTNSTDGEFKSYYGLTKTSLKKSYRNNKTSFDNRNCTKDTELSKYIWSLKNQNKLLRIKWRFAKKVNTRAKSNYCKLWSFQKLFLLKSLGNPRILNKKLRICE